MSEEEENNAQQPPPPPPVRPKLLGLPTTQDAHLWARKWSTWLAVSSAMATSSLAAYAVMPGRVQTLIPDWPLVALGAIALVSALLVPLATSIQQRELQR